MISTLFSIPALDLKPNVVSDTHVVISQAEAANRTVEHLDTKPKLIPPRVTPKLSTTKPFIGCNEKSSFASKLKIELADPIFTPKVMKTCWLRTTPCVTLHSMDESEDQLDAVQPVNPERILEVQSGLPRYGAVDNQLPPTTTKLLENIDEMTLTSTDKTPLVVPSALPTVTESLAVAHIPLTGRNSIDVSDTHRELSTPLSLTRILLENELKSDEKAMVPSFSPLL